MSIWKHKWIVGCQAPFQLQPPILFWGILGVRVYLSSHNQPPKPSQKQNIRQNQIQPLNRTTRPKPEILIMGSYSFIRIPCPLTHNYFPPVTHRRTQTYSQWTYGSHCTKKPSITFQNGHKRGVCKGKFNFVIGTSHKRTGFLSCILSWLWCRLGLFKNTTAVALLFLLRLWWCDQLL